MSNITISYLTMRRWIGIIALAFPLILIPFGGLPMQTSISAMYWTNSGVLFTALLVVMGIFLLSYKGYDIWDEIITSVAGASMIGIALFPCEIGANAVTSAYLMPFLGPVVNNVLHYIFSGITFTLLGVMSAFMFIKGEGAKTPQKIIRNRIYRICGYVIFGVWVVALILQFTGGRPATDVIRLWYWLEALMVWAFGVSWIVKGEMFLKDKK